MEKLSIIITTINDSIATNMTMAQIIQQCELDNLDYEIIVVDNSDELSEISNIKSFLDFHKTFPISYYQYSIRGTIPPHSFGVTKATGKYITMPDPHMIFSPHYFKVLIETFKELKTKGCEVLFTPFAVGAVAKRDDEYVGGSNPTKNPFSRAGSIGFGVKRDTNPFPIFTNSLSSVILEKEWMLYIGNMFPEAFTLSGGYCAESQMLGITTWMFGKKCYLQPKIVADHPVYASSKPKGRNTSMALSMATGAYILGGDEYLDIVSLNYGEFSSGQFEQIRNVSNEARIYIDSHTKLSLSNLIDKWENIRDYEV